MDESEPVRDLVGVRVHLQHTILEDLGATSLNSRGETTHLWAESALETSSVVEGSLGYVYRYLKVRVIDLAL